MAESPPHGAAPQPSKRWIWFGLDRLDEFAALHGPAKTAEVGEVLIRIADSPLHAYPGQAVPGAPSQLLRYAEGGGVRIDFLVTRPIVPNGLRLIAVTILT